MNDQTKKVRTYHLLDVEITTEPNREIRQHLGSMIQGTPGGVTYRSVTSNTKFDVLGETYFLTLKKSNRLLGTICLVHKVLDYEGSKVSAWYLRYFHIKAPMRKDTGKQRKPERENTSASRILLSSVDQYLTNPETLLPEEKRSNRSLLFGFIIEDNLRSARWGDTIEILPYGQLKLFVFTRFRPKKDARVEQVSAGDITDMKEKLKEFYSGYSLYCDQNLFFGDYYYVIRHNNEIVAGMQANPEQWEIFHKPGVSGFIVHKVLTRLPYLRRIINLKAFRFAAVEGIYYKPGYEHLLSPLMEAICARYSVNFMFCYLDNQSPVMATLNHHVKKGLISQLIETEASDIRIKFYNWDKEEEQKFTGKPFYISCLDST